jgi:hypothetical protein
MKWVEAGDLKTWGKSNQRKFASLFPELIRRLISASAEEISVLDFPSGDSISSSGWDGRLTANSETLFSPEGSSGWEFGIKVSPGVKAENDYTKRTKNPLGLNKNKSTFVFATTYPWPTREQWVNKKRKSKEWKNVKVIAADDLETWLEQTPAVSLWLAEKMGKVNSFGVLSIEGFWEEWSSFTNPPTNIDLVTAGRESVVNNIHEWIRNKPAKFVLQGESPDEPIAFLYCAADKLPEIERVQFLSKCLVAQDSNQARQIIRNFKSPLIIVLPAEASDIAGLAIRNGHHVFIAADSNIIGSSGVNKLPRLHTTNIFENLKKIGVTETKARKISKDSGRSLPVLRRRLSDSFKSPSWAKPETAQLLLPILFVGAWDESKQGDKDIVGFLSGKDYEKYVSDLQALLQIDDSPLMKIGSIWMLKSPLDSWFICAKHLNTSLLERYEQVMKEVVLKPNPKYELEPKKRWAAAIYGKVPQHSSWLKEGLVESLALTSVFHDQSTTVSISDFSYQVVRDLIRSANSWESWASINGIIPRLAEASPRAFLEELKAKLKSQPELFISLMKDDGDTLFGDCNHSGLLWALEALSWDPKYFGESVGILSDLAEMDPGGRYSNRPINTLTDIFLPFWPQTFAKPDSRIAALDKLISTNPRLVWKFTRSYHSGSHFSESYRFRWYDYGSNRSGFDKEETPSIYHTELIKRLEKVACERINTIEALDDFTRLPDYIKHPLISQLEKVGIESFSSDERKAICDHIRDAMNWINSFGNEEIKNYLLKLRTLLDKFTPDDLFDQHAWLLESPWPNLPEGNYGDHTEKSNAIESARNSALRELLDNEPLNRIISYAANVQYIGVFGQSLGTVIKNDSEDNGVVDAIISQSPMDLQLLSSYSQARIKASGNGWIEKQIQRLKSAGTYSPEIGANIYLGLPENKDTWLEVAKENQLLEREYWKKARGYSGKNSDEDASYAVKKLISVRRYKTALEIAGDSKISISSHLLKEVVEGLLASDNTGERHFVDSMIDYYLANVFKQLHKRKELTIEEIAKLEWPYASLFDRMRDHDRIDLALHELLGKDPALFADMIGIAYKRDDGKVNPKHKGLTSDKSERLARNANMVLETWDRFPGEESKGSINSDKFMEWIQKARQICSEQSLTTGCDLQIARIISRLPTDKDGNWPHNAGRNALEILDNEIINRHVPIEIRNSRGVTTRGPYDGGKQEAELAEKYKKMSEFLRDKWPVSSHILDELATSYKRESEQEDIQADLHEIKWG